jgi:hypothetical protein
MSIYATMCKKCFVLRIMRDISHGIRISECFIVTSEFHSYSQLHLNFTEECWYPENSMSGLTHYFMPCWPTIFCKSVAEEEGSILKLIELGETWSCTYNHTVRNWQLHIVGYHRYNVSSLSINPNLAVSSCHWLIDSSWGIFNKMNWVQSPIKCGSLAWSTPSTQNYGEY